MKKNSLLIVMCLILMGTMPVYAEEAPASVKALAKGTLASLGMDPVIVAAVKKANAQTKTLDQIKQKDEVWRNTPGIDDFMKGLLQNECAKHIRNLQNSHDYYMEIFVMDNQGANVAMTDKTSDYWQGDEDKFIKSFNQGKGAVFVDQVEFDDSSQAYLVQVSVPVMDGGASIGAITFGIDVDKVQ